MLLQHLTTQGQCLTFNATFAEHTTKLRMVGKCGKAALLCLHYTSRSMLMLPKLGVLGKKQVREPAMKNA